MKPEMGPWAEEYTVKMKDIRTKLNLTTHNGQPCHKSFTLQYRKLFERQSVEEEDEKNEGEKLSEAWNRKGSRRGMPGHKILLKGEEGTGKTLFCKKLTWDWANGYFVRYLVVFFICLKLVHPGNTIENVILEQYSWRITDMNVKRILHKIGDRCLVILDGFDKCTYSSSLELLCLIKEKYSHLNILVTTRPELDIELERTFHTVAIVEPFIYSCFENIALITPEMSQMLQSSSDMIRPNIISPKVSLSQDNPMLRTFLYVLAGNNALDPKQNRVSLGQVFTKLVRQVYKSYKFVDYIGNLIGKIAFLALMDPGMICQYIPYNDPLLVENPGNGVVFKQTSIQIYLAALYFVLEIDAGKSVSSLFGDNCTHPLLITNYLFLFFTLWFLRQTKEDAILVNLDRVYQELVSYVKEHIDFAQLDLTDTVTSYPALDITFAERSHDELVPKLMTDVIAACENTEVFFLASDQHKGNIVPRADSAIPSLKSIGIFERLSTLKAEWVRSNPNTSEAEQNDVVIHAILNHEEMKDAQRTMEIIQSYARAFSLHLVNSRSKYSMTDIALFMRGQINSLTIYQNEFLFSDKQITSCPELTQINFKSYNMQIHKNVFTALCQAVANQRLPKLSHLSFWACDLSNEFRVLFQKSWETLSHLDVAGCFLDEQDVRIICAAADDSKPNCLPKLSTLNISPKYLQIEGTVYFLKIPWVGLKALEMFSVDYGQQRRQDTPGYASFVNALNKGMFPNLIHLGVSECSPNQLNQLKCLQSLKLNRERHCGNIAVDIKPIAENVPLFKLVQLDLSHLQMFSSLAHLFYQTFPNLELLSLRACLSTETGHILAQANVSGRFPRLKYLDITGNSFTSADIFELSHPWKELQTLHTGENWSAWQKSFQTIASMLETKNLDQLRELHVKEWQFIEEYVRCRECGLLPKQFLKKQMQLQCCPQKVQGPPVSTRTILTPIVNNLEKIQDSGLNTIYVYSYSDYSEALDEKLKIRRQGIKLYLIDRF